MRAPLSWFAVVMLISLSAKAPSGSECDALDPGQQLHVADVVVRQHPEQEAFDPKPESGRAKRPDLTHSRVPLIRRGGHLVVRQRDRDLLGRLVPLARADDLAEPE